VPAFASHSNSCSSLGTFTRYCAPKVCCSWIKFVGKRTPSVGRILRPLWWSIYASLYRRTVDDYGFICKVVNIPRSHHKDRQYNRGERKLYAKNTLVHAWTMSHPLLKLNAHQNRVQEYKVILNRIMKTVYLSDRVKLSSRRPLI
jgi:hypothetical protein